MIQNNMEGHIQKIADFAEILLNKTDAEIVEILKGYCTFTYATYADRIKEILDAPNKEIVRTVKNGKTTEIHINFYSSIEINLFGIEYRGEGVKYEMFIDFYQILYFKDKIK